MHDDFQTSISNLIKVFFNFIPPIRICITKTSEKPTEKLIDSGGAYCKMENGIFFIYIHEDLRTIVDSERFKTGIEYRFKSFFESLDVPVTKESIFLFSLLHELGHLETFEKLHIAGLPEFYLDLLEHRFVNEKADMWENNIQIQFDQYFNVLEAQADIFAMTYFLKFWELVEPV